MNIRKRSLSILGIIVLTMLACSLPAGLVPTAGDPVIFDDGTGVDGLPDFTVEIISVDKTTIVRGEEPWTWLHYRITNIGTVSWPGEVRMQFVTTLHAASGYIPVEGPFAPGVPVEGSFAVGHHEIWELGEHILSIAVDYDQQVQESIELNNVSNLITFTVIAP